MPEHLNEFAPVNIAKPVWACPHCGATYGADHDRAAECAAAGPAGPAQPSVAVLDLRPQSKGAERFGFTTDGGVERVFDDAKHVVAHRRRITLGETRLDPADLTDAPVTVLANRPQRAASSLDYHDPLRRLAEALGEKPRSSTSWASPGDDGQRPLRHVEGWSNRSMKFWLAPLDDAQRAAAEIVVKSFSALAEADPAEIAEQLLSTDPRKLHQSFRSGPTAVVGLDTLGLVAVAHGASNQVVATRFITDHAETITSWVCTRAVAWANGEQVICPPLRLFLNDSLPRSPGKRRLAVLDGVGASDYRAALHTVEQAIRTEAPVNPVSDLGDAVAEYLAASEAARKERT